MAIDKEIQIKAKALLSMGDSAKEVSEKLDISYQTVQSWKRRLDKENEGSKELEVLMDVDIETLHTVADKVKEVAPANVVKKVDKLVDGLTSLEKLEPKFHAVCLNLLEAAEEMSMRDDLSVKDWTMLANGIGGLYSNIFNKSGVNVNVMNSTNISGEKLSMFKGSMKNV